MGKLARFVAVALAGGALFHCADLRPIKQNVCGNGVVEPGEDCDSFAQGEGTACRSADTAGACRLDCTAAADGTRPSCPSGWGCGTDGICRQPSGSYSRLGDPLAAGAWRAATGDFDGDGRADVLTRDQPAPDGLSKLRVHYFDSAGNRVATTVVPGSFATPTIREMNGDGRADVTFATAGGAGVLLGQTDRSLVPVAYPSYGFEGARLRMLPVRGFPNAAWAPVFFVGSAAFTGLVPYQTTFNSPSALPTEKGPEDLAGEPRAAKLFDSLPSSPCDEAAFAFKDASEAVVYPLCRLAGAAIAWNDGAGVVKVALPGGAKVAGGITVADVNRDGHLDLLIGTVAGAHVAYGNGVGAFRSKPGVADPGNVVNEASPLLVRVGDETDDKRVPLPLAVGDLNSDGIADVVIPNAIYVSSLVSTDGGPPTVRYREAVTKDKGFWEQAAIADFNGNGFLDVVVGSRFELDLAFYNGDGTGALNPFTVPTSGGVSHFAVGDVDGDLLNDLVFAQSSAFDAGSDTMQVAWGRFAAAPATPVSVGNFDNVVQAMTLPSTRGVKDIGVIFEPTASSAGQDGGVAAADGGLAGVVQGSGAILSGTGDRQPLAPLTLTGLAADVSRKSPFAAAPGLFTRSGAPDLAVLAPDNPGVTNAGEQPTRLWLGKAKGAADFEATASGKLFASDIVPTIVTAGGQRHASLLASGDVDGDGADEAIVATPFAAGDGSQGALFVCRAGVDASSRAVLDPGDPVMLPFRVAQEGQLAVVDVDGDGAKDVVLLTGSSMGLTSTGRSLRVLWNSGGAFDPNNALVVSDESESPEGFTMVTDKAGSPPSFAYVTKAGSVILARTTGRALDTSAGAKRTVLVTRFPTGVASGDVDGDGVEDLTVVSGGNLIVLKGEPVLR